MKVAGVQIRSGEARDLAELTEIYNHYVVNSHATFDLTPFTVESRAAWFVHYRDSGRHRLLVAEGADGLLGYATSSRFRDKAAYDTSVETTVYLRPEAGGRGLGTRLYAALFRVLAAEDVHRAFAGIALPNAASVALHTACGFTPVGTFAEVGRKFDAWWDVAWYGRALP